MSWSFRNWRNVTLEVYKRFEKFLDCYDYFNYVLPALEFLHFPRPLPLPRPRPLPLPLPLLSSAYLSLLCYLTRAGS